MQNLKDILKYALILTAILALLEWLTYPARGQAIWGNAVLNTYSVAAVTPAPAYLLSEGFEGTGYENTWIETGTPDEDYTGVALDGSQSLLINPNNATMNTFTTFTEQSELWVYFMMHVVDRDTNNARILLSVTDAATNVISMVEAINTGTLRITHGSAESSKSVAKLTNGVTYHVWVYYKAGTGSDGLASLSFDTTATKPGAPNCAITTGTATTNAYAFRLGSTVATTHSYVYDKVRVNDSVIESSPE